MVLVLIVGLLMNAIALPLAANRVLFLSRVISSGQPAPDRVKGVTGRVGAAVKRQVVEVFGQKKMLKWSVPGTAHFFVMWAFFILATVYLEAYGNLIKIIFEGNDAHLDWAIPIVGDWAILGFLQDFIAVMALIGLGVFWAIRLRNQPKQLGRKSRFFGSHLGPAYLTLFMIFNVIWTMFLFRGASSALGNLPYESGAFVSIGVGNLLDGMSEGALEVLEGVGLLLHIGVMLVFLIFVLNSKHLHIFLAPLNVMFGRDPIALGAAKPMMSDGKALTLEDLEDLDEDAKLGVGAAEDFSWKGILDFSTCTECGRCQDQCPAWNTEKPLSPKLMIMALRDHTMAKAPYLLADEDKREALLEGNDTLAREVERPLVGDTGDDWFYMPENGSRRDRPRRALVLRHLWRLRAAVPRRHRARRPHHRHAPLPGAGRVELPRRAQRAVQGPGEQGQPVEHVPDRADGLGQGPAVRRQGRRRGRRVARRGRVAVLGRLRRRLRGPRQEDHPRGGRAARHGGRLLRRARQRRDLHR